MEDGGWCGSENRSEGAAGLMEPQPPNADILSPLWLGPMHWFSDWPVGEVPQAGSLVYTIWNRSDAFVYVGISGRSVTVSAKSKGPLDRLSSHASTEAEL